MKNQSSIIVGIFLILLGVCFFIMQFVPSLGSFIDFDDLWPLIPLGIGAIFFLFGLVSNPPLLVPGTILGGIGAILFVSNTFSLWDFWQLWLLVPAFVGLGVALQQLRAGRGIGRAVRTGGPPFVVGLVLFGIFSLIHFDYFDIVWPLVLIGFGLLWLLRALMPR